MKLHRFLVLFLAPLSALVAAAPALTLPFVDEFDATGHDWNSDTPTWIAKISDGRFTCENLTPNAGYLNWVARHLPLDAGRDFEVSTRVKMLDGTPAVYAGIIWDGGAAEKKRFFDISSDGTYRIYNFEKGAWDQTHDRFPSKHIRKTEDNDLTIRVIGDRVYYFINGAAVEATDFPRPADAWVGLMTPAGCTNSFDRFEVRYLDGPPAERAANARKYEAEAKAALIAAGPPLEEFIERFDDNSRNWPFIKAGDGWSAKIENGMLEWDNPQKQGKQRTYISRPINPAADYELSFRARQLTGEVSLISIIWNCNSNSTTGLEFGFGTNGYYTVAAYNPGKFSELVPWVQTNVVKPKDFNELRVRKLDQTLFLFINGQLVADAPARDVRGDQFGIGVSFGMKVAFDEIRVSYPTLTAEQVTAEKEKLIAALKANHGKPGLGVSYSVGREQDRISAQISAQAKVDMEQLENQRWKLTDADFKQLTKVRKQFSRAKLVSLYAAWGRPARITEGNSAGFRVYYNYKLVGRTQYYYEFPVFKNGSTDPKDWVIDEVQHSDRIW
jgi:hypothetical protein